jgi:hypothetical protein
MLHASVHAHRVGTVLVVLVSMVELLLRLGVASASALAITACHLCCVQQEFDVIALEQVRAARYSTTL